MGNHNNLAVWKRSHQLSIELHLEARKFSSTGAPGLKSQLLRSVAAIPANIAEGCGQHSDAQLARFLSIAIGSANEVENHLMLAHGIGLIPTERYNSLRDELREVRKMLYGFRKYLLRVIELASKT